MLKREENMANLGVTFPLRQMTTYEQCMKVGVMLTPYIELNDCKKDTRHEVTKEMIAQWMQEKLLMGVVSETERGPMNPKKVKGLAKVN
jgi:hypothetical protein